MHALSSWLSKQPSIYEGALGYLCAHNIIPNDDTLHGQSSSTIPPGSEQVHEGSEEL